MDIAYAVDLNNDFDIYWKSKEDLDFLYSLCLNYDLILVGKNTICKMKKSKLPNYEVIEYDTFEKYKESNLKILVLAGPSILQLVYDLKLVKTAYVNYVKTTRDIIKRYFALSFENYVKSSYETPNLIYCVFNKVLDV